MLDAKNQDKLLNYGYHSDGGIVYEMEDELLRRFKLLEEPVILVDVAAGNLARLDSVGV